MKFTHQVNLVGYSLHFLNRGHRITSASTTLITWNLLFYATKQLWTVGKPPPPEELWRYSVVAAAGYGGTLFHPWFSHLPWTPHWLWISWIWRPDKALCSSSYLWVDGVHYPLRGGWHCQEGLCLVCRSILIGSICSNTTLNFRRGNFGVNFLFISWHRPQTESCWTCGKPRSDGEFYSDVLDARLNEKDKFRGQLCAEDFIK